MRKFFVEESAIKNNKVFISGEDVNHIKNVLRLKVGDNIIVSNGKYGEYEVKIIDICRDVIEGQIVQKIENNSEPSVDITLFQGIPKGEKMELIIQKAVEIGVKKIIPVITERVIVKLDKKSAEKKAERWQKISEQAAKQCGRNVIPEVEQPISYNQAIKLLESYDLVLVLYEKEKDKTLKEILSVLSNKPRSIAVLIGPEGGFSEKEVELVSRFIIISLGPRILRTETAGLVAVSIILYQSGDLG